MDTRKYYWLAVTADKYELPIAVADTAGELAQLMGTTENNIRSAIAKNKNGKKNGYKFIRVKRL